MYYLPQAPQFQAKSNPDIAQIWSELVLALKEAYDEEGLLKIVAEVSKESFFDTRDSKVDAGVKAWESIKRLANKTKDKATEKYQQYRNEGVKESLGSDWHTIQEVAVATPGKMKELGVKGYNKAKSFKQNFLDNDSKKEEKLINYFVSHFFIYLYK